eukprot:1855305-Pleurochrysis_carterae.AAC.2
MGLREDHSATMILVIVTALRSAQVAHGRRCTCSTVLSPPWPVHHDCRTAWTMLLNRPDLAVASTKVASRMFART